MHSLTDMVLVAVFVAGALGCDDPYAEVSDSDTRDLPAEAASNDDGSQRTASFAYEDPRTAAAPLVVTLVTHASSRSLSRGRLPKPSSSQRLGTRPWNKPGNSLRTNTCCSFPSSLSLSPRPCSGFGRWIGISPDNRAEARTLSGGLCAPRSRRPEERTSDMCNVESPIRTSRCCSPLASESRARLPRRRVCRRPGDAPAIRSDSHAPP
jgi:hypothetical protein